MTTRQILTARGITLAAVTCMALGAAPLAWPGTASAGAPTDQIFDLSAQAVAVDSTTTDPAIPLNLPFSVGSYGASSYLNSNGESTSDAGAPYSPLISSLPSTGNGLAQSSFGASLPVVPKFPGYVSAKEPLAPISKQNAGGYELIATATPTDARGTTSMGGQASVSDQNNAFAMAHSALDGDGDVISEGVAGVHALTLGGILDIANFSSYASLAAGPDGKPTPRTTTSLGTITFAELSSGLTGRGFTVAGSTPTPISTDGLAAINERLMPAGITLTYLPEIYTYTDGTGSTGPTVNPNKTVSGLTSGAVQIFITNTSDRGTTTETITVGRVSVNATTRSPASDSSGTDIGAAGTGFHTPRAGAADADPGVGAVAAHPPGSGAGLDVAAATPPGGTVEAGTTTPVTTFLPAVALKVISDGTTSFESSYLLLVGVAVALLAGRVVRILAARRG
jgi:hypothetical protein